MSIPNSMSQFTDIKQLMITKLMLSNGSNNQDDMYSMVITMLCISGINYLFTALPTITKYFQQLFEKKINNIKDNIIPTTISIKPIKSRIFFSRNYTQNEGYQLIDALIEYLSNIDAVVALQRKRFYVMNPKDCFKVNEDIFCSLKVVLLKEDAYERIDFELYSETLSLTELRKWVDTVYKNIEYNKQNKFGDDLFYFNEIQPNVNIRDVKNLMFSMTKFTTNKSLNTLYGKSIKTLKTRIDLFKNNSTWYKNNGIPHTLGILLSGPPGTGKSSAIKAIAKELNRHIFNLKLSDNTTQQQLWNLFYNDGIFCSDENNNTHRNYIPPEKRIYVLEDVDVLTSILLDRKLKDQQEKLKELDIQGDINAMKKMQQIQDQFGGGDPKLNLSFFLNLLDGVLETPSRILIITSNYPEKLDKAILRPGRIDINMVLGYCDSETLREMFSKFYKGRTNEDFNKYNFDDTFANKFTPAYIQKILSDNFDEPMKAFEFIKNEYISFNTNIQTTIIDDKDTELTTNEFCNVNEIKQLFLDEYGQIQYFLNSNEFTVFDKKFNKKFIKQLFTERNYEQAYEKLWNNVNQKKSKCEFKDNSDFFPILPNMKSSDAKPEIHQNFKSISSNRKSPYATANC